MPEHSSANPTGVLLRHLRVFMAVADEGQIRRASESLHLDQSSISRRIHALEKELGITLFERRPGGLHLTPAGQALRTDLDGVVGHLNTALERARLAEAGLAGTLRVGLTDGVARDAQFLKVLGSFEARFPDAEVKLLPLLSTAQIAALRKGDIDVGIMRQVSDPLPDLEARTFAVHELLLAVSAQHRLACKEPLTIADLAHERIMWPGRAVAPLIADQLSEAFQRAGITPTILMEANTSESVLTVAASGRGIGFVISAQVRRPPPGVVLKRVADFHVPCLLQLLWNPARKSPFIPALVGDLVQEAA
jgi:DNA-binding transcriptional LysR family regulator